MPKYRVPICFTKTVSMWGNVEVVAKNQGEAADAALETSPFSLDLQESDDYELDPDTAWVDESGITIVIDTKEEL